MPALSKTKKIAKRTVSATNLKSIGLAGIIYADDHEGRFPSNLDVLVTECDLSRETLVSPRKPDDFNGPSYILIEGLSIKAPSPATMVLAYENPSFCDDSMVYSMSMAMLPLKKNQHLNCRFRKHMSTSKNQYRR
jgi:hypothetical protein